MILIDDLIKESFNQEKIEVTFKGKVYETYRIAKPLNYNYPFFKRVKEAFKVLIGKGIVVQYFSDIKEKTKIKRILT
jgi:hypothetical protein